MALTKFITLYVLLVEGIPVLRNVSMYSGAVEKLFHEKISKFEQRF